MTVACSGDPHRCPQAVLAMQRLLNMELSGISVWNYTFAIHQKASMKRDFP
jgi:hypothetical protein